MSDDEPPAVPPVPHPLASTGKVLADRTARTLTAASDMAKLAATPPSPETVAEFVALQVAVLQRFETMTQGWSKAWHEWFAYATEFKGANTVSKIAEKETNIAGQLTAMIGSQITDLVTLQENVEVNYAYWIQQKLEQQRGGE
jgi:hypothetical protein